MKKSEEIKNLILETLEKSNKGTPDEPGTNLSKDENVMVVGSDPTEWTIGHDNIVKSQTAEQEGMPKATYEISNLHTFEEGTVGWYVCKSVAKYENGKELEMRVNGVMHKEDGKWKSVFQNYTIEVPNEKIGLILENWKS